MNYWVSGSPSKYYTVAAFAVPDDIASLVYGVPRGMWCPDWIGEIAPSAKHDANPATLNFKNWHSMVARSSPSSNGMQYLWSAGGGGWNITERPNRPPTKWEAAWENNDTNPFGGIYSPCTTATHGSFHFELPITGSAYSAGSNIVTVTDFTRQWLTPTFSSYGYGVNVSYDNIYGASLLYNAPWWEARDPESFGDYGYFRKAASGGGVEGTYNWVTGSGWPTALTAASSYPGPLEFARSSTSLISIPSMYAHIQQSADTDAYVADYELWYSEGLP